eukprot:scaffold7848_cov484-Prasinococcus_capsulatus_cf.AAC.3
MVHELRVLGVTKVCQASPSCADLVGPCLAGIVRPLAVDHGAEMPLWGPGAAGRFYRARRTACDGYGLQVHAIHHKTGGLVSFPRVQGV